MNIRRFESIAVILIALHSFIVGMGLMFWPSAFLDFFEWGYDGPMFFPAQSGIFHILLSVIYFATVKHRKLIWFIILCKGSALVFLLWQYFLLGPDVPGVLLPIALFDGFMGAGLVAIFWLDWHLQQAKSPD